MSVQETIDNISERVNFETSDKFRDFLHRSIKISKDTVKSTYAIHDNILFKMDSFFLGLKKLSNDIPKAKRVKWSMDIIIISLDELGLEVDKEDAFIFYHLRELGKFRKKSSDLWNELKVEWKSYPEYELSEQEFARSLKHLMRTGLIDFRRGNLTLKLGMVISYRN